MNIKLIEEKLNLLNNKGIMISGKQSGYMGNNYDPIDDIEFLKYHYTPNELILFGGEETIKGFDGIAGYDFSIESASIYAKVINDVLFVTNNSDDILFFKDIIDAQDNIDIDDNGDIIDID